MENEIIPRFDAIADAEEHIRRNVRMVVTNRRTFHLLSTGEKIAVALVLDRRDLLKRAWGSMLASIDRLGPEWTKAALRVQRNGWD
jgi:hypothetical protein